MCTVFAVVEDMLDELPHTTCPRILSEPSDTYQPAFRLWANTSTVLAHSTLTRKRLTLLPLDVGVPAYDGILFQQLICVLDVGKFRGFVRYRAYCYSQERCVSPLSLSLYEFWMTHT